MERIDQKRIPFALAGKLMTGQEEIRSKFYCTDSVSAAKIWRRKKIFFSLYVSFVDHEKKIKTCKRNCCKKCKYQSYGSDFELMKFLFYFAKTVELDSGRCSYVVPKRTQFDGWLLYFRNSFWQFVLSYLNRKWWNCVHTWIHKPRKTDATTQNGITTDSHGNSARVNRICVFGTWWETRMFIVNIKTCHRHGVIGHIYLYTCIVRV